MEEGKLKEGLERHRPDLCWRVEEERNLIITVSKTVDERFLVAQHAVDLETATNMAGNLAEILARLMGDAIDAHLEGGN